MATSATKKRKPSWRTLPCPMCGALKSIKEFVNGFAFRGLDDSKYIHTGCDPLSWPIAEVRCENCGWGVTNPK